MRFDHLKRRDIITLLGGAAAWPRGQQSSRLLSAQFSRAGAQYSGNDPMRDAF